MPVGCHINKRDNLSSEKALTKSKVFEKNNSKLLNVDTPGLHHLDIKHNTTFSNLKENITDESNLAKSEANTKGLRNLCVYLVDFKLNDKDSNKLSSKRKSKVIPSKEAISGVGNEIRIETPTKKVVALISKEESKVGVNVITENLYDTLKQRGRHTKKKDEKVEKVDATENTSETVKKRSRKKDENEIESISTLNVSNPIIETVIETLSKTKNRLAKKKDESESVVTSTNEVDIVNEDIKENTISKLNRKNVFQKGHEHKFDTVKLVVEKIDVDGQNNVQIRSTASRKPNQDSVKLDYSNDSVDLDAEQDNSKHCVRTSIIANVVKDEEDTSNKIVEKEKQTNGTIPRFENRSQKSRIPFVVEKDENNAVESKEMKIPGLVMLNNIKSRKSEVMSSKQQAISKNDELKKTLEKAVISVKSSATVKKIEKPRESIIQNEMTSTNQEKIPIEDQSSSIKPNVRKSTSSGISQDVKKYDKIPDSFTTEEVKKRETEAVETLPPKKRISIFTSAPKIMCNESKENEMTKSISIPSAIKLTDEENISSLDSPVTTSISNFKRSSDKSKEIITSRKAKVPLIISDKIPGLSTTAELRKQKFATLDANFKLNQKAEQSKDIPDLVVQMEPTEKLDSSSPIKILSCKDQKPTIGILSKPFPYKRRLSCLESNEDEIDPKCKISRIQGENRRQSVTFNREVEVKEINGNSFNSITDDGCSSDEIIDEQQLRDKLERTEKQRNIGSLMSSHQETKKASELSNLISTRIKSNSPSRGTEIIRTRPCENQQQLPISSEQNTVKLRDVKESTPTPRCSLM